MPQPKKPELVKPPRPDVPDPGQATGHHPPEKRTENRPEKRDSPPGPAITEDEPNAMGSTVGNASNKGAK